MTGALYDSPVTRLSGDTGLIVEFGEGIDPEVNARVRAMAAKVRENKPKGLVEIIPTYRSLLFIYDPSQVCPDELTALVQGVDVAALTAEDMGRLVEIPVCYGADLGPDLDHVSKNAGLDPDQVIQIHSEPEYLIYMVGFTPGFAFLGGLDPRLTTPRLSTPRTLVPEGSVGIANNQTGMYPIASPGGWQLIGRTPLRLFAPERENPFLYQAGDRIRFTPVSIEAYTEIKEKENADAGH